MFDIGFPELMIVAVVMLLVLGPERLPETLRMLGLWLGRLRRSFNAVKTEIEREVGMDEIKRQLHNEAIMEEMKRLESQVKTAVDPLQENTSGSAPSEPSQPVVDPEPDPHPNLQETVEASRPPAGEERAQ